MRLDQIIVSFHVHRFLDVIFLAEVGQHNDGDRGNPLVLVVTNLIKYLEAVYCRQDKYRGARYPARFPQCHSSPARRQSLHKRSCFLNQLLAANFAQESVVFHQENLDAEAFHAAVFFGFDGARERRILRRMSAVFEAVLDFLQNVSGLNSVLIR